MGLDDKPTKVTIGDDGELILEEENTKPAGRRKRKPKPWSSVESALVGMLVGALCIIILWAFYTTWRSNTPNPVAVASTVTASPILPVILATVAIPTMTTIPTQPGVPPSPVSHCRTSVTFDDPAEAYTIVTGNLGSDGNPNEALYGADILDNQGKPGKQAQVRIPTKGSPIYSVSFDYKYHDGRSPSVVYLEVSLLDGDNQLITTQNTGSMRSIPDQWQSASFTFRDPGVAVTAIVVDIGISQNLVLPYVML